MRLIDLSQPVTDNGPNCPAHPPVRVNIAADHPADGWRLETLSMATHTGSHVDAPFHKMAEGKRLGALPLETFVGPAYIADLRGIEASTPITPEMLSLALPGSSESADTLRDAIVLLATGWGDIRAKTELWESQSPYLSPDGASYLVSRGVRAVGIDHYSIGGSGADNDATHINLLSADVWIVEELRFPEEVFALPQPVHFWCLPVNFGADASGAFCRPVIMID